MSRLQSIFNVLSETNVGTLYVIFDQVQHPEAYEFWCAMKLNQNVEWRYLWQDSQFAHFQEASPILITLYDGNPGESLLYWLNDYTENYERLGIVGRYNGGLAQIHQHWLNWVSVFYPDTQEALLRFYDPAVISFFYSILTDVQKQAFRGEHIQLYLPCIHENKPYLSAVFEEVIEPQKEAMVYPITLTSEQFNTFFYPERLDSLIDSLHSTLAPDYAWLLPRENVAVRFYEGLELAAKKYPNADTLGHETFALYRFYLGDKFNEHPDFYILLAHHSLRAAIGKFNQKYQGRKEELMDYYTPGWLGIEGKARLES
ncbi:DUF4123 domain-containing protein [Vibrio metschnikovii]|uniref:DUF4123 domain-containing protein n=1 Tax=Vibrio metschnikovii TaxID=28172 RepID=UPI002FCAF429